MNTLDVDDNNARTAARSEATARSFCCARFNIDEKDADAHAWAALKQSMPGASQIARKIQANEERTRADLAAMRILVTGIVASWSHLNEHGSLLDGNDATDEEFETPRARQRRLECIAARKLDSALAALESEFAKRAEVSAPVWLPTSIKKRGRGDQDDAELHREIAGFVAAFLAIVGRKQPNATDRALVAIAWGFEPAVIDDARADGIDAWDRRLAKWRTATRRQKTGTRRKPAPRQKARKKNARPRS